MEGCRNHKRPCIHFWQAWYPLLWTMATSILETSSPISCRSCAWIFLRIYSHYISHRYCSWQHLMPILLICWTLHLYITSIPWSHASNTDIKQVNAIHNLLTEGLQGETDEVRFTLLQKQLMGKNTKAIQFMWNDLQLQPVNRLTRFYKKDWVVTLVKWVGLTCLSTINVF